MQDTFENKGTSLREAIKPVFVELERVDNSRKLVRRGLCVMMSVIVREFSKECGMPEITYGGVGKHFSKLQFGEQLGVYNNQTLSKNLDRLGLTMSELEVVSDTSEELPVNQPTSVMFFWKEPDERALILEDGNYLLIYPSFDF